MLGGSLFSQQKQQLLRGDHDPRHLLSVLLLCILLSVLAKYVKQWGIFGRARDDKRSKRAREFGHDINESVDLSAGGVTSLLFQAREGDESPTKRNKKGT